MSDLTTRLQIQAEWLAKGSEYSPDETIYGEAANLIEQLQQRNDELAATVDLFQDVFEIYGSEMHERLRERCKKELSKYPSIKDGE